MELACTVSSRRGWLALLPSAQGPSLPAVIRLPDYPLLGARFEYLSADQLNQTKAQNGIRTYDRYFS